MSSTPFGEHLKREREMRGVSLEEISAATRISTRFLDAIEREQWDLLPGGVFNRGFIRAIGRFLGLDEDSLVAEYALETRDAAPPRIVPEYSGDSSGRPWLAIALFGVLVTALVAGSWFAISHYGVRVGALLHGRQAASTADAQKPVVYPDAIVARSAADPSAGPPASGDPAATGNAIAVGPSGGLKLKLEAGKSAEVKIITDGTTVFDGHIEAGAVKQVSAQESFEISSSDASALFLELNGQTVPPIGMPGQAGNITLTRRDLRPAGGGTH
jgi:transcriptional regulator with XRE-family HTH domain